MGLKKVEFENLVDRRVAYTACFWTVADNYGLAGGWISPTGKVGIVRGKRFVLPSSPLTDSDLFLSLARLWAHGEPSKSSILRWVEKHGVLLDEREEGSKNGHAAMKLETFRVEARRAYWLLDLYADIRARDVEAIKARVSDPKSPFDKRLREEFEEPVEEGGTGVTVNSDEHEILWLSFLVMMRFVERELERVRLSTSVRSPEEFDPKAPRFDAGWRCPNLLSALYLQFYWLITNHTPTRRCENPACGMPFPLTRKNKRFCNASCRSNARHYE